jgi:AcrR family transcriptional regulator
MSTSRSGRRRRETADRIVEAAAFLFGERGVEATKVSDICAQADVAHQTFFNHFPSKQDLVRELVQRGHAFLQAAIADAIDEDDGTEARIARVFTTIHEAAATVGPMHRDMVSETLLAAHETNDPENVRRVHGAFEKLVRAGRARGDVTRRHATEDLVALLIGGLSQLMFDWAHQPDFPFAARSARMARLLAEALAPRPGEKTKRARA